MACALTALWLQTAGMPGLLAAVNGTRAGGASTGVAIPLSTGWVEPFLLAIVWLFVAAVIIGPLVKFFHLEPRSPQPFVDDPKVRH